MKQTTTLPTATQIWPVQQYIQLDNHDLCNLTFLIHTTTTIFTQR